MQQKELTMKKGNDTIKQMKKKLNCNQKVCYICKQGFSTDGNHEKHHKVRNHCHYTGKYRGAVHDNNKLLKVNNKDTRTVYGSTYDYKFIINELEK